MSYEMVHDFFRDPFDEDMRHVVPFVAAQIVRTFAHRYCSPEMLAAMNPGAATGVRDLDQFLGESRRSSRDAREDEYEARIVELERTVTEPQRICDERALVISALDIAARERLAVVERLDEKLKTKLAWRRRIRRLLAT